MAGSRLLLSTLFLVACAGSTRYRSELVGTGNGIVAPRVGDAAPSDHVAAPGAGGIQLAQGTYELAMRFDIPRAQIVDWKLVCPGADVIGQVGETLEQYRARRIEELRRDRDRERQRVANATSIVVGAMAPRARTEARSGNVTVHAEASVNPDAVGAEVARTIVDDRVMLAPGDVGRGSLASNARVMTAADGACTLQVTADDPDVRAVFTVTRIRDLHAEERMRTMAAREVAVKARGDLSARLVTNGADPAVRQARVEAEAARANAAAAAQLEARARADAQLRARADLRARLETDAIYARQEYLLYLSGKCNAQPGRRERQERDEVRRREARLMADAALAQRRDQAALRARLELQGRLVAFGAKARPPKPAPLDENPGTAPFTGASWVAGHWGWSGETWEWTAGGWYDPTEFGDAGSDDSYVGDDALLGVSVGAGVGVELGGGSRAKPGTRDHRRPRVTDHRDDRTSSGPAIRDHRSTTTTWTPSNEPKVRDHRESGRPSWEPKDHDNKSSRRDDKKDDDDDKPVRVRDHRR